ncbi:hypothetical protein K474DRAFT_1039540 [Panus rudis PR-1116 ss-1]|nr:hypothetical protein K474DRAFT_1039540 [Panus rudis PR-1116 ss-1]
MGHDTKTPGNCRGFLVYLVALILSQARIVHIHIWFGPQQVVRAYKEPGNHDNLYLGNNAFAGKGRTFVEEGFVLRRNHRRQLPKQDESGGLCQSSRHLDLRMQLLRSSYS